MAGTGANADTDTIAAIATAPGRGAIGLLRLSGPAALTIAQSIAGRLPQPRVAALRDFRDRSGEKLDRGIVIVFEAPRSYTGEHLVELQAHGGPVLLQCLLQTAVEAGARIAKPGEFSERAFLNGRLDLAQAEAVADLIDAASRNAVVAANRSLDGELSRRVEALADDLMGLRAWIEGALDFSDEDVDWLANADLLHRAADWLERLAALERAAHQGRRLREGIVVAIVGEPNVGKSTLLNQLAGVDAAIVSDIPGTTRDVLREHITIAGIPITVVDTAGLRETSDRIEQEGIRRARIAIDKAELVLYVTDNQDDPIELSAFAEKPVIVIRNKTDLAGKEPERTSAEHEVIRLSAATGEGVELLRAAIVEFAGMGGTESEAGFTARARHLTALGAARQHAEIAIAGLVQQHAAETIAEELRLAHDAIGEITGKTHSEDLLGRIFASFCIGK